MKSKLLYLVILSSLFTGCAKVMYVPNSINVPLLKEKNEFSATISFTDYQFAYAISQNIGLMLNGYVNSSIYSGINYTDPLSDYSLSSSNYSTSRNLIEGGVGYFTPLDEGIMFETYVGFGSGKLSYDRDDNNNSLNTNYKYSTEFSRIFIQPSIGYTNDFFDIAFSARVVKLDFNNIETKNYNTNMLAQEQINNLDKTSYYFIEPAVTVRLGYKWGKLELQGLYSNKINAEPLNYQTFSINVGLHINLATRFKKSKGLVTELNK